MKKLLLNLITASFILFTSQAWAEPKLTVYSAASLTNVLSEITANYEKAKNLKVVNSFAASSSLAKQIENGAPADIFISADNKWMNYLQDKKKIQSASRQSLLANRLVLIAPKGKAFTVDFSKPGELVKAFDGRLCMGDLESVPAGIYGKQSLVALNWWDTIKSRIVGTQDVRAALVFVERGECAAGIVYETDAKISSKVDLVGVFPEASHDPIVYPVALTAGAQAAANDLLDYITSAESAVIFARYGFTVINKK